MKKFLSIFLVAVFAILALGSCAEQKTTINVKIVVDNGDDGKYEQVLVDKPVEVKGKNPNLDTILNTLNDAGDINVEFKQNDKGNTEVVKINDLEVKDDDQDGTSYMYRWYARVNKQEVNGVWADQAVKEGDEVIIRYEMSTVNIGG